MSAGKLRLVAWAVESLLLAARERLVGPATVPAGPPRSILFFGYAAIGDLIMLLPTLQELRRAYPKARVTFLADRGATTLEVVPASGLADEVELVQWTELDCRERRELCARLAERGFDLAVVSLSTPAHFFAPLLARIPLRAGHCVELGAPTGLGAFAALAWTLRRALVSGEPSRRLLLNRKAWVRSPHEHFVRKNLRLLEALGLKAPQTPPRPRLSLPPEALAFAERALGPKAGRRLVAVHLGPTEGQYFKTWPARRFGALCRKLAALRVECVLVGGPLEQAAAAEAQAAAGAELKSFVGQCTLLETLALVKRCDLLLANDTGIAKAAMAMGVPTATLWGPTDPRELGVLWDPELHLDVRTGIHCSPCAAMGMPRAKAGIDYTDCGHHDCLRELEEDYVFLSLQKRYPWVLRP